VTRMRIGISLLFLGEASGGVGRHACELVGALAQRDDVALEAIATRDALPVLRREAWHGEVRLHIATASRAARGRYVLAAYAGAPAWALRRRLDVLHSPANIGPIATPGVASVITIHDLIWSHAGLDWGTAAEVETMRRATAACVHRADRLLADSDWTQRDVIAQFGVPADRIDVVLAGVRADPSREAGNATALRRRLGLDGRRIVLCVAQKRPYKRQESIVRALAALPADVVAVLPGAATPYEDELRRLAADLGVTERVVFPPWLSDDDLEALYRCADVCAFPSLYEGFGLPVLEAMARGVPVACSDRASLPEVAGDAALLFDPDDQAGVDAALRQILGDEPTRARLIKAGHRRVASFTWARTAEQAVESYRRALADRGRRRLR